MLNRNGLEISSRLAELQEITLSVLLVFSSDRHSISHDRQANRLYRIVTYGTASVGLNDARFSCLFPLRRDYGSYSVSDSTPLLLTWLTLPSLGAKVLV